MSNNDLPLETYFRKVAQKANHGNMSSHRYCDTYFSILSTLQSDVYQAIDIALTQEGGIYTFHNSAHFDEVVRQAGALIGVKEGNSSPRKGGFEPYEIFVLLLAIRIHDAGNCYGRVEHEQRCADVLNRVHANFPFRDTELFAIANIAEAHGGKLPDGSRDTIGTQLEEIEPVGNDRIHSQRIAATVRLADELAENTLRSPAILMQNGTIPKQNEVYHQYAHSLHSNNIERIEKGCKVHLTYCMTTDDAKKKFGKESKEVYLVDEIRERLSKMNRERVYCNRFLLAEDRLESISAKIVIRNSNPRKLVFEDSFLIRDDGYPDRLDLNSTIIDGLSSNRILSELGKGG